MNPQAVPPPFPIPDAMTGNFEQALRWMQQLWGPGASPAAALGASGAGMLRPEELERRIGELRSVERWLELHLSMIRATIQTMEMQRSGLAAWQAMSASASAAMNAAGAAPGATPGAAPGSAPGAAPGAMDPAAAFQPNAWWNAMQDQFQRLAAAAANPPVPPAGPAPSNPEAAPPAGKGPAQRP
jgi:hypothetical protein